MGTGVASTWNEVAKAMFTALGKTPKIEYIPMPDNLKGHYQYFTQADVTKLRAAGFMDKMTPLAEAIKDYEVNYLAPHQHLAA